MLGWLVGLIEGSFVGDDVGNNEGLTIGAVEGLKGIYVGADGTIDGVDEGV